ncbi:MAG: SDR family oxidoreductase [Ignavibacteriales bacterium]|nr:SDR family oxidoreductase [Ignavibacteriales bacterium]
MKIFITGGSGLLGQYLNIDLGRNHDILTQYNSKIGNCGNNNNVKLAINNYTALEKIFSSFKPEIVIHTAAVSNPEKADKLSADEVYDINVNASADLARLCSQYGAKLIYLSTDLVYAGYRGSYLREDAKLIPISLYAETKLMGEVKIKETFDNYIILREALLIGFGLNHSKNNFHLMYENLADNKPVSLFVDQFRTPLALHDSARIIEELIKKNIHGEIINLGGTERLSRYELGEILCEEAGFDKNLLVKKTMEESGLTYKVADVSLNTDKLKSLGIIPQGIREAIREILSQCG